jgi:hypothetical protein
VEGIGGIANRKQERSVGIFARVDAGLARGKEAGGD